MIKGYKATKNMKCINLTYEVGNTYEFKGELIICSQGFHFCKNMEDVLDYYNYDKDFILLEVEILGEVIDNDNISVTDKLKVLRVIPKEEYTKEILDKLPVIEYDSNNNMIHYKDSNGYERWKEYDSNNNLIHYKDSNGLDYWKEYDSNNNMVYYKDSNGYKYWKEFDENNNLTHSKDYEGREYSITIN